MNIWLLLNKVFSIDRTIRNLSFPITSPRIILSFFRWFSSICLLFLMYFPCILWRRHCAIWTLSSTEHLLILFISRSCYSLLGSIQFEILPHYDNIFLKGKWISKQNLHVKYNLRNEENDWVFLEITVFIKAPQYYHEVKLTYMILFTAMWFSLFFHNLKANLPLSLEFILLLWFNRVGLICVNMLVYFDASWKRAECDALKTSIRCHNI